MKNKDKIINIKKIVSHDHKDPIAQSFKNDLDFHKIQITKMHLQTN